MFTERQNNTCEIKGVRDAVSNHRSIVAHNCKSRGLVWTSCSRVLGVWDHGGRDDGNITATHFKRVDSFIEHPKIFDIS